MFSGESGCSFSFASSNIHLSPLNIKYVPKTAVNIFIIFYQIKKIFHFWTILMQYTLNIRYLNIGLYRNPAIFANPDLAKKFWIFAAYFFRRNV
jgi:hypothetical protein